MANDKQSKVLTRVSTFEDVQKSLQNIETQLNSLFNSVNTLSEKDTTESKGESGDINVTRNSDGTYGLETCTNEGWKKMFVSNASTSEGISEVYLGDKPRVITPISTEPLLDARYLPITPDYESDWTFLDESIHHYNSPGITIEHNLGSIPKLVTMYARGMNTNNACFTAAEYTAGTDIANTTSHYHDVKAGIGYSLDHGITYQLTSTEIRIHTGESSWTRISHEPEDATMASSDGGYDDIFEGKIKVLLWK